MGVDSFPQEVVEVLRCYVYRLIDPRNGETFYVGRGREQRVFDHVSGAVDKADHDALDPKLGRIHEIRALDMDVAHIIHRHGMSEAAAKEVEAALIDAYPGLVNRVAGSGSETGGRGMWMRSYWSTARRSLWWKTTDPDLDWEVCGTSAGCMGQ